MFNNKKVVVIMPAYNAARTLKKTYDEVIAQDCVDLVILVDDASSDNTVEIAGKLEKIKVFHNDMNIGYGGNQKICYRKALEEKADIIIMVHPDYQYTPKLIPSMVSLIGSGLYHCVIGSRILGGQAMKGGMPFWKYASNRALTFIENLFLGAKLSEYHTGYRAFSAELLRSLPLAENSDDFVFDNQVLAEIIWSGCTIAEISCPTKYFPEASSINFRRSVIYGIDCLLTSLEFFLASRFGFFSARFSGTGRNIMLKNIGAP